MFRDRQEAGEQLAKALLRLNPANPLVVALPRGGVPVGYEVALVLNAPLDVLAVRKLGAPHQPELAIGAVSDGPEPHVYLNEALVQELNVSQTHIQRQVAAQLERIRQMERIYRTGRSALAVQGKTVIVVDDGLATGSTAQAALRHFNKEKPRGLILAVPVGARDTVEALKKEVDKLVCLSIPDVFWAVGNYYENFQSVSDQEVVMFLEKAHATL